MKPDTFHISPYDVALFAAILIVLTFSARLWFKKAAGDTDRLLSLILAVIALWLIRVVCINFQLINEFPQWLRVLLQFLLSIGPLLFFYVRNLARSASKMPRKDHLDSSTDN